MSDKRTTSSVPPNTCLMHGSFVGSVCPGCSTAAKLPGQNVFAPVRAEVPA